MSAGRAAAQACVLSVRPTPPGPRLHFQKGVVEGGGHMSPSDPEHRQTYETYGSNANLATFGDVCWGSEAWPSLQVAMVAAGVFMHGKSCCPGARKHC